MQHLIECITSQIPFITKKRGSYSIATAAENQPTEPVSFLARHAAFECIEPKELNFRKATAFRNFIVSVDEQTFFVNKNNFEDVSLTARAMLANHFQEDFEKGINLHTVSAEDFALFADFALLKHPGAFIGRPSLEDVPPLLMLADYYGCEDLRNSCFAEIDYYQFEDFEKMEIDLLVELFMALQWTNCDRPHTGFMFGFPNDRGPVRGNLLRVFLQRMDEVQIAIENLNEAADPLRALLIGEYHHKCDNRVFDVREEQHLFFSSISYCKKNSQHVKYSVCTECKKKSCIQCNDGICWAAANRAVSRY